MVKLQPQNCVLKPSQRRQLLSWLKRAVHLGERVGKFVLTVTIRRVRGMFQIQAAAKDSMGSIDCKARGQTWRDACRALARELALRLHDQRLAMMDG